MTNEKASKILGEMDFELVTLHGPIEKVTEYCEACSMGSDALKNADKYKWHDLRKNPNYLPMQKTEVLIKTKFGVFFASYYNTYYDLVSCFATRSGFPYNSEEVIAWKYIEPLEGGEE